MENVFELKCIICDHSLSGNQSKYCSSKCSAEGRRSKTEKTCPECGMTSIFRSDRKYCCRECYVASRNKRYVSQDMNIFESETSDNDFVHYLIGIIWGDGNLHHQVGLNERIVISMADEDLIKEIALKISPKRIVYKRCSKGKQPQYVIFNNNPDFIKNLKEIGLKENKTKIKRIPDIYEDWNDNTASFVRGYFDANGCVSFTSKGSSNRRQSLRITFTTGSEMFAIGLYNLLKSGGFNPCKPTKYKERHAFTVGIYRKESVYRFRDEIYKRDTISMKRKKDKFYDDIV